MNWVKAIEIGAACILTSLLAVGAVTGDKAYLTAALAAGAAGSVTAVMVRRIRR